MNVELQAIIQYLLLGGDMEIRVRGSNLRGLTNQLLRRFPKALIPCLRVSPFGASPQCTSISKFSQCFEELPRSTSIRLRLGSYSDTPGRCETTWVKRKSSCYVRTSYPYKLRIRVLAIRVSTCATFATYAATTFFERDFLQLSDSNNCLLLRCGGFRP